MNIRISNIDTLSAYLDRLVVERIKWFFFTKDNKLESVAIQEQVIAEIKNKISDLLLEADYNYIAERRTFALELLVNLDELITNNLHIGESDRARLEEVKSNDPNVDSLILQEKRLRTANESRSKNKNKIDEMYGRLKQ